MPADDNLLPPAPAKVTDLPRPSLQEFLSTVLSDQQRLDTPVMRASSAYEAHAEHGGPSDKAVMFRDLIPLSKPAAGEQYAFEVNLDACSGCKACVVACHSLNGLDDTEAWRDVGLVVTHDLVQPWQQTVTTACHHCAEPGCLEGCPVVAYDKDPLTGIVRHLDDQCIGCSYCILKCPYDVPKYNVRLGIVRKCDMCHQRLAVDEAPACVQACPTHAIRIVNVPVAAKGTAAAQSSSDSSERADSLGKATPPTAGLRVDTSHFLAAAPDASYTQPTTRYISARGVPAGTRAADADALRVQPTHTPLAVMLALTQLGFGLFASAALLSAFSSRTVAGPSFASVPVVASLADGLTAQAAHWSAVLRGAGAPVPSAVALLGAGLFLGGLAASVLHLGQPLRAWRVFLGLRTSWLSREAVLFGALAPLLGAALWWPTSALPALASVAVGALAVFCSAMVYIDTRRKFWAVLPTTVRFGGTTLVAALAFAAPDAAVFALAAKLALELFQVSGPAHFARLQRGPLQSLVFTRVVLALLSGLALAAGAPWIALAPLVLGELAERLLFFRAVDAPKMPGLPSLS